MTKKIAKNLIELQFKIGINISPPNGETTIPDAEKESIAFNLLSAVKKQIENVGLTSDDYEGFTKEVSDFKEVHTGSITAVHVSTSDASWIRLFSTREKAIKYGALEAVSNMAGHPNYTDMEVENEALDNLESSNRYEVGGMLIEVENNLDIR